MFTLWNRGPFYGCYKVEDKGSIGSQRCVEKGNRVVFRLQFQMGTYVRRRGRANGLLGKLLFQMQSGKSIEERGI